MAEAGEFAVDTAVSPGRILCCHLDDEVPDLGSGRWPSRGVVWLCPVACDTSSVPAQESVGCDEPSVAAGPGSAWAMAPSSDRSSSPNAGRSTWRRSTTSWWRRMMISMSLERPDRTARRASEARTLYKMRYTSLRIGGYPPWSTPTSEFRAPTCVLKGSDDDVEDRQHDPCCASDGGRSSGVAVQAEIPNHRKLRRSRACVVSVAVDVSLLAGQVCDEKTNMCEPLLTHRNETTTASKPGPVGGPGTKSSPR